MIKATIDRPLDLDVRLRILNRTECPSSIGCSGRYTSKGVELGT
jgi:hypothetical protein